MLELEWAYNNLLSSTNQRHIQSCSFIHGRENWLGYSTFSSTVFQNIVHQTWATSQVFHETVIGNKMEVYGLVFMQNFSYFSYYSFNITTIMKINYKPLFKTYQKIWYKYMWEKINPLITLHISLKHYTCVQTTGA